MGSTESTQHPVPEKAYKTVRRNIDNRQSATAQSAPLTSTNSKDRDNYREFNEPSIVRTRTNGEHCRHDIVNHNLQRAPLTSTNSEDRDNYREFNEPSIVRTRTNGAHCRHDIVNHNLQRAPLTSTNSEDRDNYREFNEPSIVRTRTNGDCRKEVLIKKLQPINKVDNITNVDEVYPCRNTNTQSVGQYLVKPPNRLNDLDDFIRNWNIWKEQLSSFLKVTDEEKVKYHLWGAMFLNFMGPYSQQIIASLIFDKKDDKRDYIILMQKYDAFYKFMISVKSKDESALEYILKLKSEVLQNMNNVDITLKQKIAKEINKCCKERFIALAKSKLPNFKFETTFNSLTLAEIAFLWQMCDESTFDSNKSCVCCGNLHQEGNCKAFGKECNKCKRRNHFAKNCPGLMYIVNCSFCGGNHQSKRCPSYGEICSKCQKYNHFSWKCSKTTLLKHCRYCGMSHSMDRSICPAKNSLCSTCKQRGHYDIKCDFQQRKSNTD